MTNSSNAPCWDRLPDAPEEFFELQQGYGQADLKRAYFRLIKQFKPEKHPQEFQRIRAAFEQLDSQLRYGTEVVSPISALHTYTWNPTEQIAAAQAESDASAALPAKQRKNPQRVSVRPLHERLVNESPAALYEELLQQPNKQPFHYYALAVLSDDVQDKDSQEFVRWVLIGLRLFPRDPALYHLLYATIRGPIRSEDIPKLLSTISIVIPDDRFYSLTEALWDRIIRDEPFDTFRRLLAKCEANLSDYQLVHKLAFYIHFLKAALWSGDHEWVSNAFSLLETHYNELPPRMEYDVAVLFHLRSYLEHRQQFVDAHPIRKLIDQAIRWYCTRSPLEARNAFLACQVRLATSAGELLEAFPPDERSPAVEAFIPVWHFLDAEISDRPSQDDSPTVGQASVRQMLVELESKTNRTWLGKQWRWSGLAAFIARKLFYIVLFLLLYLPLARLLSKNASASGWVLPLSVVLAGAAGWMLIRRYFPGILNRWFMRLTWACYTEIWRMELQQFLSRTFLPYHQLLEHLSNTDNREDDNNYFILVTALVRNDYGLMLLSNAQKVLF